MASTVAAAVLVLVVVLAEADVVAECASAFWTRTSIDSQAAVNGMVAASASVISKRRYSNEVPSVLRYDLW
jgi:hypothetical protein